MLGETGQAFNPEHYLRQQHPGVQVLTTELPQPIQGCIDHEQRIIWLDSRLSPTARRCTLAFEVAQLELGPTPADPLLAAAHRRSALDWAALMLISSEMFAAAWSNYLDLPSMATACQVDLATFRARMRAASDADQDAAVEGIRLIA